MADGDGMTSYEPPERRAVSTHPAADPQCGAVDPNRTSQLGRRNPSSGPAVLPLLEGSSDPDPRLIARERRVAMAANGIIFAVARCLGGGSDTSADSEDG